MSLPKKLLSKKESPTKRQRKPDLTPGTEEVIRALARFWHRTSGSDSQGNKWEADPHKFRGFIVRRQIINTKERYVVRIGNDEVVMPDDLILQQLLGTIPEEEYGQTLFEFVYRGKTIEGGQSGHMHEWKLARCF